MSRVNVNALKEVKELKDPSAPSSAPAEHHQSVCPPFIHQPTTTEQSVRLANINPLIIVFDGPPGVQCQKTLNVSNVSNDRVAWRVLCNAPTRYVVSPNKGFLFKQEKIAIQVILLNGSKYHRRHAFVVQVKPAKMDENNRKLAWRDMSPTDTKYVQSTRVSTLNPSLTDAKPMAGSSSASSLSQASSVDGESNRGSSTSLSAPIVNEADHGEYAPKIKELTEAVMKAAEQKQTNTQRMVATVNEVKKLEVELDRAGQNLSQVQQKYNEQEEAVSLLRLRLKKVREQLAIAREADRRRTS